MARVSTLRKKIKARSKAMSRRVSDARKKVAARRGTAAPAVSNSRKKVAGGRATLSDARKKVAARRTALRKAKLASPSGIPKKPNLAGGYKPSGIQEASKGAWGPKGSVAAKPSRVARPPLRKFDNRIKKSRPPLRKFDNRIKK